MRPVPPETNAHDGKGNEPTATLTIQMLDVAFKEMWERPPIVHGSREDPHLLPPRGRGGWCVVCGWRPCPPGEVYLFSDHVLECPTRLAVAPALTPRAPEGDG